MAEDNDKTMVNLFIRDRFKTLETGIQSVQKDTQKILKGLSNIDEWRGTHTIEQSKNDVITGKRLNSHADDIKSLFRFKNKTWGVVIGVPPILTIIGFAVKYILGKI